MAALVWFTMGLSIWHFTVFLPHHEYRFWGGIVGALIASAAGAMVTGAIYQLVTGDTIGETSIVTAIAAVPGSAIGLAAAYASGWREERREA